MKWINTDETQWVKKVSDNRFEVVDVVTYIEDGYYVKHIDVDINLLTDKEIQSGLIGFYPSLENVKEIYGDDWMQIVAECIAENETIDNQSAFFEQKSELQKHLNEQYGIQFQMEFNNIVETIVNHHTFRGKVFTHWGDDVEELLNKLEVCLTDYKNTVTKVVVVWDRIEDEIPQGKSEIWIISKQTDGIVGSRLSTLSSEAFLKDLFLFGDGKLPLQPIEFHEISPCNMVRYQ